MTVKRLGRAGRWAVGVRAVQKQLAHVVFAVAAIVAVAAASAAQSTVDLARLDAYFSAARDDWRVPGFAVAIVKDGQVVFERGYGVRELGENGAVDEHTLFAIASNTKAFTAAALARLVDAGHIGWEDRVEEHLAYFQLYAPYVTHEMRVRDLLCHRSGLGTFSGDLLWYGTTYSREEVVRRARHLEPAHGFRADYGYSNLMFIAAGEIVPAVTGRSWDEYVREEFFVPLGMTRTRTSVRELAGETNVATPHGDREGRPVVSRWYVWDNAAPAGGIISSVSDMSRWLILQLERGTLGGRTYFSEEVSRMMWTPHIPLGVSKESEARYPSTHLRGYGLGWSLMDYRGRLVASHGGGYDGMFSRVALVPEERLGLVVLTNSMTSLPVALTYRILDAYLGGEARDWSAELLELSERNRARQRQRLAELKDGRVAGTEPSLDLDAYTGLYGGELYGDATVTLEDGELVMRFLPAPDLVADLRHWHYDTFEIDWRRSFPWFDWGTVKFELDKLGNVVEMKVDVPNEDLWFTELGFQKRE